MKGGRLSAGDVVGKYEIIAELGSGGMAVVYEAVHRELGSHAAVKVLRAEYAASTTFVGRFSREARALVRLQSEHVARVLDVGTIAGTGAPYMVMERLTGRDLRAELRARGPLPIEVVADWLLQASEAIAEAHARGIVHRDLKPSNLFLARRDDGSHRVKVLDFGIAKAQLEEPDDPGLTGTQEVFGSPSYMSPEQLRASSHVDARSDVWSLGVVLYELLAGAGPFRGAIPEVHTAVLAGIVPRMPREDVPPALCEVIDRCLEKEPDRRFPSVAAFARALAPFAPAEAPRHLSAIESWARTATEDGHVTVPHRIAYEDTKQTASAPPPPPISTPPEPGQQTNTNWDRDPDKRKNQQRWIMIGSALAGAAAVLFAFGPGAELQTARTAIERAVGPMLDARAAAVDPAPSPPPGATAAEPVTAASASATAAPKGRAPSGGARPPARTIYDDRE